MARVSLILPLSPGLPSLSRVVRPYRESLEAAGHEVDVLVVADGPDPEEGPHWTGYRSGDPGAAAAAVEGLNRAEGDILLVLDPEMDYPPEDLPRVIEPLEQGTADLTVASRAIRGDGMTRPNWLRAGVGWLARPLTGTTDPLSGLIGLTRELRDQAGDAFRAVGTKFSFELLAKLHGRWVDVPSRTATRARLRRPEFDDLRHLKRLADHRFGNLSRLVQFCFVGGTGMVVDLLCYWALQPVFARTSLANLVVPPTKITVSLTLARCLAIGVALCWNFSLNRRLTFSYARHGSLARQFFSYLLSNMVGVFLSLGLSLGLPRKVPFFDAHKLAAAVIGIVVATGANFSLSRWVVFRRKAEPAAPVETAPSVVVERSPTPDGSPGGDSRKSGIRHLGRPLGTGRGL